MKHLRGIVESPTAPNTTDVLWLDADGGLKAFKNGGWKSLVEKGSGSNSGGNSGNTAEPNIIYETDIMMYSYNAIQPKIEQGESLVKTDNLENTFVKLNLMMAEDIKFNTILIPVQYSVFPFYESGQSLNVDMFTGRYDVLYNIETQLRLAINISIACMEGFNMIAIEPLKVNDVYLNVDDIFSLSERTYEIDVPIAIPILKANQFSEIYLKTGNGSRQVRLNNIIYSGDEDRMNTMDGHDIIGSYVYDNYLYKVFIAIPPAASPYIKITTRRSSCD